LTISAVHAARSTHELPGDELRAAGVLGERVVGEVRLLGQSGAAPPAVAHASDEQRREQRRVDRVAHRVGHREPEGVAVQREVECVATDVARGLEPCGERELPALAGVRARQEAVLDLRGQRERDRALPPVEEVGVAPVGDDDVRERVRRRRDVGERGLVRGARHAQLEDADGLAAARHRREQPRRFPLGHDLHRLRRQRAAVGAVLQRHAVAGLAAQPPRRRVVLGVAEPDQGVAAEVGDEEADVLGPDHRAEDRAHDVGRRDGRSGLDGVEQPGEIQAGGRVVVHAHRTSVRVGGTG
jgi:hypothetical protein